MLGRRTGRKLALEALYEGELSNLPAAGVLERSRASNGFEFANELVEGVMTNKGELDETISKYSQDWALERMPVVDRNVLRIGVFELLHDPETPTAVVINEAVELAKKFSTEDSGRFVNGVLSAVAEFAGRRATN